MKKHLLTILAVSASTLIAAEVVTTKTTTTTGTVSEFAPGRTFIVKETAGPVTYRYGKTVAYVTKAGKPLSDEEVRTRIRVGLPVSVQYTTEGDARVVSRVIIDDDGTQPQTLEPIAAGPGTVTKTTKTTTTTTSNGTLSEFTPGTTFVVKETTGPVNYRYGKTITYVTKSGKTLSDDEVRTRIRVGAPVRIQYGTEGDVRVVNRVEIDD
jgi:hypothetical protein